MNRYFAAVDIGGTKITVSIADKDGLVAKVYQSTEKQGDEGTVPRQVDFLVCYLCRLIGIEPDRVAAVGISTASPFALRNRKIVILVPSLCGGLVPESEHPINSWTEIPLERELDKHYVQLSISNDCVAAVVAERMFGAGQGEDDLAYVSWSTGIGAGAYVDGHLLKGKNSNAVHLGHIFLATSDENQPRCNCGSYGHLEALAAGPFIAKRAGIPAPEVFRRCRAGESASTELVSHVAKIFARGLADLTCILDTRVIVIGGSVALNNWDLLAPIIREEFYSSFPSLTRGVRLCLSGLGNYLGDIAALSLVLPKEWLRRYRRGKPWQDAPPAINLDT